MKWFMCGTLFIHISTSLECFCPPFIFFKIRIGQVTHYNEDNQQGFFPGLATDSPFGVWGRGVCLLYEGSLLDLGF